MRLKFILIFLFIGIISVFSFLFFLKSKEQAKINKIIENIGTLKDTTNNEKEGLSAWVPYWDEERSTQSFKVAASKLKTISPCWYRLSEEGIIKKIEVKNSKEILKIADENNIPIIPTIGNDFDGKRFKKLISDEENKQVLLNYLISETNKYGYSGWEIDWEEIKIEDREKFVTFISFLSERLHQKNLMLIVDVHALISEKSDWEGARGHDYEGLGKYADQIVIMTYDFHSPESEPGAITPMSELLKVANYALKTIPKEKIVIGIPLYGYDWHDQTADSLTYSDIKKSAFQDIFKRDEESKELVGTYTKDSVNHTVWYNDQESVFEKIKSVTPLGINNFKFWRLGGEDPRIW